MNGVYFLIGFNSLGLVGGILLLKDKTFGGVLAIVGGSYYFVLYLFALIIIIQDLDFSTILTILVASAPIVGGIMGLLAKKEEDVKLTDL